MKNLEKKIVCAIVALILCACSVASIFSFAKTKDVQKATSSEHPFGNIFSGVYGVSNSVFGKVIFTDDEGTIYKLKNGHLAVKQPDVDVLEYKDELKDLKEFLDAKGIGYSFVMTAECGDERQGKLPLGIKTNNCERVMGDFSAMLESLDIKYIDTYKELIATNRNYYDYFFKTDHHWNDEAGLYLAEVLAKHLNENYSLNLDLSLFSLDNHYKKTYPKHMFGSLGKKVGNGYAFTEDFSLYLPKYETSFKILQEDRTGSYFDCFIYQDDIKHDPNESNMYHAILHGEHKHYTIHNQNVNNGKRILLIKDSKANIIATHLACAVEYVDFIDLRRFDGNVKEYIESTNPDVVLNIQSAFSESVFYEFDR